MKLVIEGSHLKRILGIVGKCVPARATMPILQHVVLKAQGSTLTVSATNLEREASAYAPAHMDRDGTVAIPGKVLCDLAQNLMPGAQVSFELGPNDKRVRVTSGAGTYTLGILKEDQPTIAGLQGDAVEFEMEVKALLDALSVNYAACKNITLRPNLYGVRLERKGDKLISMGFDEARMGFMTVPLPPGAEDLVPVTIPFDAVPDIIRLVSKEEKVTVRSGRLFQIVTPTFCFTTKVMGEKFSEHAGPALENVLRHAQEVAKIHPTVFKDALKRASVVYASGIEKYEPAILEFKPDGVVLNMGESVDTAVENIDAEVMIPGQKVRLNRKFLGEVLDLWPEDTDVIVCLMEEAGRPVLLKSAKSEARHFLAPMLGQAGVKKVAQAA